MDRISQSTTGTVPAPAHDVVIVIPADLVRELRPIAEARGLVVGDLVIFQAVDLLPLEKQVELGYVAPV